MVESVYVSPVRLVANAAVLVGLVAVGLFLEVPGNANLEIAIGYGAILSLCGLLIAAARGGLFNWPFYITALVAYPALTPWLVTSLFGFGSIAPVALFLQEPQRLGLVSFLGGLSALALSLTTAAKASPCVNIEGNSSTMPLAREQRLVGTLVLVSVLMPLAAVLADPTPPLGFVYYGEIVAGRIESLAFAGGVWLSSSSIGMLCLAKLETKDNRSIGVAKVAFFATLVLSILWIISHGRRVELVGFFAVVLILYGSRVNRVLLFLTIGALGLVLSFVGYFRVSGNLAMIWETTDSLVLPGGTGFALLSFLSAISFQQSGQDMVAFPGESYLDYLFSLPPGFLGIARPELIYERLTSHWELVGGTYFLAEGIVNFGFVGVAVATCLPLVAINLSVRAISHFENGDHFILGPLMGVTFLANLPWVVWYGWLPGIKGIVIASVICAFGFIVSALIPSPLTPAVAVERDG